MKKWKFHVTICNKIDFICSDELFASSFSITSKSYPKLEDICSHVGYGCYYYRRVGEFEFITLKGDQPDDFLSLNYVLFEGKIIGVCFLECRKSAKEGDKWEDLDFRIEDFCSNEREKFISINYNNIFFAIDHGSVFKKISKKIANLIGLGKRLNKQKIMMECVTGRIENQVKCSYGEAFFTDIDLTESVNLHFLSGFVLLHSQKLVIFGLALPSGIEMESIPFGVLTGDSKLNLCDRIDTSKFSNAEHIGKACKNLNYSRVEVIDRMLRVETESDATQRIELWEYLNTTTYTEDQVSALSHIVNLGHEIAIFPAGTYFYFFPSYYELKTLKDYPDVKYFIQVKNTILFLKNSNLNDETLGAFIRDNAKVLDSKSDISYKGFKRGIFIENMRYAKARSADEFSRLNSLLECPVLFYKTETEYIFIPHWKASGIDCQIPFLSASTASKCVRLPLDSTDHQLSEGLKMAWVHCEQDWTGELSVEAIGPLLV